jgi:hypothetical protein
MSNLSGTACLVAAAVLGAAAAHAQTDFPANASPSETLVETYATGCGGAASCATDGYFGNGAYWGANVNSGGENSTTEVAGSYSGGNGVTTFGTITLTFNTTFAETCVATCGVDPVTPSQSAYAADIFLDTKGAASPVGESFDYAIALGYTSIADGGLAEGLYAGSYGNGSTQNLTSSQVWGNSKSGGYYGGAFAYQASCNSNLTSCSQAVVPPVAVTGSNSANNAPVSGVTVSDAWNYAPSDPAADTLTVTLEATTSAAGDILSSISDDLNIFWATADNSDAPYWADSKSIKSTPEPSTLALLLGAALGFVWLRRRKRIQLTPV